MAENKKSFVLYADQRGLFDKLPDELAGNLIKHIFSYVNDEHPETSDLVIEIAFESIKTQLKRDLKKWEHEKESKSDAGIIGNLKRWNPDLYKLYLKDKSNLTELLSVAKNRKESQSDKSIAVNVNDNVSVNDTVNVNEYKRILLSEVNSDDYPNLDLEHIEIAKSFQELFIKNQTEGGVKNPSAKKAKGIWIDDIRMMIEIDKVTKDDFRKIFGFLKTDDFWKKNILSTSKLRKQFEKLLMNYNNGAKQQISTKDKLSQKMENIINSTEEH